jgi:subtilisin family serine protease
LVAPGGGGTGSYNPNSDIFSSFLCPLSPGAISEGGFFPQSTDSNFGTAAGTSAATPFVSGAAALIWSFYPNLTNTQVAQAIVNNTDSLNGNLGWNAQTGYGRLNVYQALLNAGNGGSQVTSYLSTFNSPNPFYTSVTGTTNITIAITQAAPVELTIYDSSGEAVFYKNYDPGQLNNNPSNPQFKSFFIPWDGKNGLGQPVVTGIYFYTVKVNGQVGRNKIALIQGGK